MKKQTDFVFPIGADFFIWPDWRHFYRKISIRTLVVKAAGFTGDRSGEFDQSAKKILRTTCHHAGTSFGMLVQWTDYRFDTKLCMKNLANLKSTEPSEPCSKFIAANVEKRWRHFGRFSFKYSVEKFYFEMPIAMVDHILTGKIRPSLSVFESLLLQSCNRIYW